MRSLIKTSFSAVCLLLSLHAPAAQAAPAPAAGGTAHSAFQGQYAFTFRGKVGGPGGLATTALGSFTADGNGNVTAGFVDFATTSFSVQRQPLSGSYSLDVSGRGTLTLKSAILGTQAFTISTQLSQAASLVEKGAITANVNMGLLGAGELARQNPSSFGLLGQYVLDFVGTDASNLYAPITYTGQMNLVTPAPINGANALVDQMGDGVTVPNVSYTGGMGSTDPVTGVFTLTFIASPGPNPTALPGLSLDGVYIDSTHIWLIETQPWAGKPYVVLSGVAEQ